MLPVGWRVRVYFGVYQSVSTFPSAKLYVDNIRVYNPTRKNPDLLKKYLSWVEGGGRLIVLNSLGMGDFAKLLNLTMDSMTVADGIQGENCSISLTEIAVPVFFQKDDYSKTIANYTRGGNSVSIFALQRKIGDGEIVYINVLPYLLILQTAAKIDSKQILFTQLDSLIGILSLQTYDFTDMDRPVKKFIVARDEAIFSGFVEFKSNSSFIPDLGVIRANYLDLSSAKVCIIKGIDTVVDMFSEVEIQNFQIYGSVQSSITTFQAKIMPFDRERYLSASFNGKFNWTITLSDDETITMEVLKDNSTYYVIIRGGVIKLTELEVLPKSMVLMRNPKVYIQGATYFKWLMDFSGEFRFLRGHWLNIEGNTSFRVADTDKKMMLITDFVFSGTKETPSQLAWDEWNIPWPKVMSSMYHLSIVIASAFVMGVYIGRLSFYWSKRKI